MVEIDRCFAVHGRSAVLAAPVKAAGNDYDFGRRVILRIACQADAAELPARIRRKKIPIAGAYMR